MPACHHWRVEVEHQRPLIGADGLRALLAGLGVIGALWPTSHAAAATRRSAPAPRPRPVAAGDEIPRSGDQHIGAILAVSSTAPAHAHSLLSLT